ncbi:MAG: hypothetical protein HY015_09280, partial [Bacteroidetes bacterium]|nr:hypothetical protein [Bacteroidota bacterium]
MSLRFTFLFILLVGVLSYNVAAQSTIIDSLRQLLQKSEGKQRVDVLNAYAYSTLSYDYWQARKSIEEANKLSNELNYKKGIAESLFYQGIVEERTGRDSAAMINFRKSLSLFSKFDDPALKGRLLASMGLAK